MKKSNIYEHLSLRIFLKEALRESHRGTQAKLAKAIGCQATYVIKVLKETANFTDDQAFRAAKFLKLGVHEFEYFMDLVRLDRAGDSESRAYFLDLVEMKSRAAQDVQSRVKTSPLESSLEAQVRYFSSIKPSLIHLATSCRALRTPKQIAQYLNFEILEVQNTLSFLVEQGLVNLVGDEVYAHSGKAIHLAKTSPLQPHFQRLRRQLALAKFDSPQTAVNLHFSSSFATTKKHLLSLRKEILRLIEEIHESLAETDSEEIATLVVDFF